MSDTEQLKTDIKKFEDWLSSESNNFYFFKIFPEKRIYGGVRRLIYHWTLIIGEVFDTTCYLQRYCYSNENECRTALEQWNGEDEPSGWYRSPGTGRRRPDGDPSKEYIDW